MSLTKEAIIAAAKSVGYDIVGYGNKRSAYWEALAKSDLVLADGYELAIPNGEIQPEALWVSWVSGSKFDIRGATHTVNPNGALYIRPRKMHLTGPVTE